LGLAGHWEYLAEIKARQAATLRWSFDVIRTGP
jgi:hypothetical protein